MKPILILLFLVVARILTENVNVISLDNTPGILPFKIGYSKIITSKHTFLHYICLDKLQEEITQLKAIYQKLKETNFYQNPKSSQNLLKGHKYLKPLISEIEEKYQNIAFIPKRQKRGLFNFVGTINKWFSGTLDANDGERYDNAIKTLERNQQNIVQEFDKQVSLSKHLISNYANTVEAITKNQQKIVNYINEHEKRLKTLADELYTYIIYSSIIDRIQITANMLITFLDSLENAITFSNLHTLHPDVVTINELREIIEQLGSHHSEKEIIQLDLHAWYSIIKTSCHFSKSRIIFALDIPITYPETFNLYHLYPIPTMNNTLLIPQKPYLALQEEIYQYMDFPCDNVDELHLCIQEHLLTNPEQECIPALILGRDTKCQPTTVHTPEQIFEKVNEEYVIVITKRQTKIKQLCRGELQTKIIMGTKLLQVPTNCTIEIQNFKFGNIKTNSKGHPLILPELDFDFTETATSQANTLKLDNIPLSKLHSMYRQMDAMEPITLENIEKTSSINWTLWTIIVILGGLLLGYVCYKIWKYNNSKAPHLQLKLQTRENKNLEDSTPSVLFNPEVVA